MSEEVSNQEISNKINNSEDFDFNADDLIRGETPHDIKEKCIKYCKKYLSGNWKQQTVGSIEVRRVSGGLTNQLYYCGIIDKSDEGNAPQEVAIRFYGPKHYDSCDNETNERLSDVIIGLMVSQNKLGPKIYGIFDEGQIQMFYKHRPFDLDLQKDITITTNVMQSLAQIHSMDVPIKKNPKLMFEGIAKKYGEVFDNFDLKSELGQIFKDNDFIKEFDWLKDLIESYEFPIVFSHNDYRSSNLMITEPNNELVVCDFEYGSYWYRGYDLANLMKEWGHKSLDFKSVEGLPPKDSEFKPLIEIYVKEWEKICGKKFSENKKNSIENILKETKIFLLYLQLFYAAMLLSNLLNKNNCQDTVELPFDRRMSMKFADLLFENYFILKEKLIKQNVFI